MIRDDKLNYNKLKHLPQKSHRARQKITYGVVQSKYELLRRIKTFQTGVYNYRSECPCTSQIEAALPDLSYGTPRSDSNVPKFVSPVHSEVIQGLGSLSVEDPRPVICVRSKSTEDFNQDGTKELALIKGSKFKRDSVAGLPDLRMSGSLHQHWNESKNRDTLTPQTWPNDMCMNYKNIPVVAKKRHEAEEHMKTFRIPKKVREDSTDKLVEKENLTISTNSTIVSPKKCRIIKAVYSSNIQIPTEDSPKKRSRSMGEDIIQSDVKLAKCEKSKQNRKGHSLTHIKSTNNIDQPPSKLRRTNSVDNASDGERRDIIALLAECKPCTVILQRLDITPYMEELTLNSVLQADEDNKISTENILSLSAGTPINSSLSSLLNTLEHFCGEELEEDCFEKDSNMLDDTLEIQDVICTKSEEFSTELKLEIFEESTMISEPADLGSQRQYRESLDNNKRDAVVDEIMLFFGDDMGSELVLLSDKDERPVLRVRSKSTSSAQEFSCIISDGKKALAPSQFSSVKSKKRHSSFGCLAALEETARKSLRQRWEHLKFHGKAVPYLERRERTPQDVENTSLPNVNDDSVTWEEWLKGLPHGNTSPMCSIVDNSDVQSEYLCDTIVHNTSTPKPKICVISDAQLKPIPTISQPTPQLTQQSSALGRTQSTPIIPAPCRTLTDLNHLPNTVNQRNTPAEYEICVQTTIQGIPNVVVRYAQRPSAIQAHSDVLTPDLTISPNNSHSSTSVAPGYPGRMLSIAHVPNSYIPEHSPGMQSFSQKFNPGSSSSPTLRTINSGQHLPMCPPRQSTIGSIAPRVRSTATANIRSQLPVYQCTTNVPGIQPQNGVEKSNIRYQQFQKYQQYQHLRAQAKQRNHTSQPIQPPQAVQRTQPQLTQMRQQDPCLARFQNNPAGSSGYPQLKSAILQGPATYPPTFHNCERVRARTYAVPTLNSAVPERSYPVPIQNYSDQNYPVPTQNYPVPTQNYPVPTQNYPVPTQNYTVPTQNIQWVPPCLVNTRATRPTVVPNAFPNLPKRPVGHYRTSGNTNMPQSSQFSVARQGAAPICPQQARLQMQAPQRQTLTVPSTSTNSGPNSVIAKAIFDEFVKMISDNREMIQGLIQSALPKE